MSLTPIEREQLAARDVMWVGDGAAAALEENRGRGAALAGEHDARREALAVEVGGLEQPPGRCACQHHDGIGVRRKRIRHDQETPGLPAGPHGTGEQHHEQEHGGGATTHRVAER